MILNNGFNLNRPKGMNKLSLLPPGVCQLGWYWYFYLKYVVLQAANTAIWQLSIIFVGLNLLNKKH